MSKKFTQGSGVNIPQAMLGVDEMIACVDIAIVLEYDDIAADRRGDAQRVVHAEEGPRGLVESLDMHPTDVAARPFVEYGAQKGAVSLCGNGLGADPVLFARNQRQELQERLKVGDILTGRVSRIQPFGAFVSLGAVDGLVPASELSWKRGVKPEDIVQEGQEVTVMVRDLGSLLNAYTDQTVHLETDDGILSYRISQRTARIGGKMPAKHYMFKPVNLKQAAEKS